MSLLSSHRKIERRESDELRAQLSQRDAVLYALLKKVGPQTLTVEELTGWSGETVSCEREDAGLTFKVVEKPLVFDVSKKEESV